MVLEQGALSGKYNTQHPLPALLFILKDLKKSYPNAIILGHRDFKGVTKKCPCFDARKEYAVL